MSILLVHFLPRGQQSNTRRLVAAFRDEAGGEGVVDVDLAREAPPMFDAVRLAAYTRRNYQGVQLSAEEQRQLAAADRQVSLLEQARDVVLAFPIYNFSVPAPVKAWIDAVTQKGRTWDLEGGVYRGKMAGRRALVLMTAGGSYRGERASWDHATPLVRHVFEFMGFDGVEVILADGMNSEAPDVAEQRLCEAEARVRDYARERFGMMAGVL
ncbi:MAG TPA: NAD(P)H-dependent oxidoreductase [Kiritimatiellia bacterium]|nr:NAD(P)H-dependent oxidoreductase [Kiritimatiellia bacterium]